VHAIIFRWRILAGPDIDLNGGQDQYGHAQCLIARGTHGRECALGYPVAHVDIAVALLPYRTAMLRYTGIGRIVVAQVQACAFVQAKQLLYGSMQLTGIASGEIATRSAHIGHEQGVANEHAQSVDVRSEEHTSELQ